MGYTPLFDTLIKGTLSGKWPDIGLWPVMLSLADRHGVIDATPAFISGVTGLALAEVLACLERFCQPDPYSRSQEKGGARLELLDPERAWGWVVVNHSKYREKARLAAKSSREVASGLNAGRMEDRTAADRRSPPGTASDHPSKLQTTNIKPQKIPSESMSGAVERVFEHWRTTHNHPRSQLDDKRSTVIRKALKHYPEADICQSLTGYLNSPHHMGQNDRNTKYTSIELLLGDAEHIDAGLAFYANPPRTDLSAKTLKVIAQTENWIPPEARHAGN